MQLESASGIEAALALEFSFGSVLLLTDHGITRVEREREREANLHQQKQQPSSKCYSYIHTYKGRKATGGIQLDSDAVH